MEVGFQNIILLVFSSYLSDSPSSSAYWFCLISSASKYWSSSGLHPSTCLYPLLTISSTSVALSTTCVLTTLTFISSAWTSPLKYSGIANIYLTSLFECLISISHLTSLKMNLSFLQTYCSLGLSWLRKWYIHPCSCLSQKPIESVSDIPYPVHQQTMSTLPQNIIFWNMNIFNTSTPGRGHHHVSSRLLHLSLYCCVLLQCLSLCSLFEHSSQNDPLKI